MTWHLREQHFLNNRTVYALDILLVMSRHNAPMPSHQFEKRFDLSPSYVDKILQALRFAGLATSVRGPGGGYIINHELHDITLADVIQAVNSRERRSRIAKRAHASILEATRSVTLDQLAV